MGLYEQSLADGAQAIQIFAELSGMDPEVGNTLIPSQPTAIVGLYGATRVTTRPNPAGGESKRTEVKLSIARETLAAAPQRMTKVVRIDLAPHIPYVIEKVDTQDPVFWVLTCANYGG